MGVKHRDPKQVIKRIDERLSELNAKQARAMAEIKVAELDGVKPDKGTVAVLRSLNVEAETLREKRAAYFPQVS
jgi:hypothetical protein